MDVVQLAVRDVDEARDAAPQIEQRVHLHRRLGGAKVRPRKHRQAQVDGGRIQRIDGVGQIQPESSSAYSFRAWAISRWANSA